MTDNKALPSVQEVAEAMAKADPLRRKLLHVEWVPVPLIAASLGRYPQQMMVDEDEAKAIEGDINLTIQRGAFEESAYRKGRVGQYQLSIASTKLYLKHCGHQNAGRTYMEWFGIEDLPVARMPSPEQFQQNMQVMGDHDHQGEGYAFHTVKAAVDDFIAKTSDVHDTEIDRLAHILNFLSGAFSAYKLICPAHPNADDVMELVKEVNQKLQALMEEEADKAGRPVTQGSIGTALAAMKKGRVH